MLNDFVVDPYVGVGPLRLGMSRGEVQNVLGLPDRSKNSRFNAKIIDQWTTEDITVVFSDNSGTAVEIGFGSEQAQAEVRGIKIFGNDGPSVYRDLCVADGAPRTDVGFTVLFSLGLTLDGFLTTDQDDRAVTVFAKGTWDERDPNLQVVKL
jgi:hypothetical protein